MVRVACTRRGAGLLKSSNVKLQDLQDMTKPIVIVGTDVESLYPSLEDDTVADLVSSAIMETDTKFMNIDYKEAARYIALNWTEQECRTSILRKVLPWRKCSQGSRP